MNPCDNIDIRIYRLLNQTLNRSDSICRFVITNNAVTNGRGNRETWVGTIERVSIRAYIGGRKKKRDRERETAGVRNRGSRAGRCHKTKRDSRNASCFAHSPSLPKFFTEYLYIPRQNGPIFSTIHRTDRTISLSRVKCNKEHPRDRKSSSFFDIKRPFDCRTGYQSPRYRSSYQLIRYQPLTS